MKTAADTLEDMAATFRERNAVYGDNYLRLGQSMHALFPQGLTVATPEDWTRLYFFMLTQVKLSRYATNFSKGGHADSAHDSAVYGALLETYDERIAAEAIVATAKAESAKRKTVTRASDGKMDGCDGIKALHEAACAPLDGGKRKR